MITFNFYDYKRKHFEASDILEKEKTLRNMLKPNTWKELEGMLQCAGFKTAQPFWRNHMFVGAIAIKQGKIMNDFLKDVIKETGHNEGMFLFTAKN